MKKLLIDVNTVVPFYVFGHVTGIGRTTIELIKSLDNIQNIGFDIELYSQNMKGIGGNMLGTRFKNKHLYIPNRKFFNQVFSFFPIKELYTKYDLMHIPHNYDYVYNPKKCITTLHDALFMHINEKAFNHAKMRIKVPPFIRSCKHVITCSEYSKNDIVQTMDVDPEKIDVVYWGIKHHNFFKIKDNNFLREELLRRFGIDYPYFISVSCNAERKRTDKLIEGFIKHFQDGIKNHLVLVWSNPPEFVHNMIRKNRLEKYIHFLSNVTDEDLRFLYNGATVSFTPSSFEGFGLPIVEAMACGTPVISACNSSLKEIGKDYVFYLDEPITDSISQYMDLIENEDICFEDNINKGLEYCKLFDWGVTAQQMVNIYRRQLLL